MDGPVLRPHAANGFINDLFLFAIGDLLNSFIDPGEILTQLTGYHLPLFRGRGFVRLVSSNDDFLVVA